MLLSFIESLSGGDVKTAFITLLLSVPVILLALTVHECAHGYVAYLCGDSTAKAFGRLTLNPAKHLDPIGALCMMLVGFGWAKPVPVNMRNLRKPKRDMVLVSLAGPVSNLLLAFISAAGLELIAAFNRDGFYIYDSKLDLLMFFACQMLLMMVMLNIGLALFNLIPLPPLDGSKILAGLLPNHLAMRYLQIERYTGHIFLAVMLLSFTGVLDVLLMPLDWARGTVLNAFLGLFEFLFRGIG